MQDIVLYCKSYHRDVLRVMRLLDIIERHNVERLPVCISMPANDRALFEDKLDRSRCTLIDDEQIVHANPRLRPADTAGIEGRVSQAKPASRMSVRFRQQPISLQAAQALGSPEQCDMVVI